MHEQLEPVSCDYFRPVSEYGPIAHMGLFRSVICFAGCSSLILGPLVLGTHQRIFAVPQKKNPQRICLPIKELGNGSTVDYFSRAPSPGHSPLATWHLPTKASRCARKAARALLPLQHHRPPLSPSPLKPHPAGLAKPFGIRLIDRRSGASRRVFDPFGSRSSRAMASGTQALFLFFPPFTIHAISSSQTTPIRNSTSPIDS